MVKKSLTLIAVGFPLYCFTQTTLSIPGPSGTQCVGADCSRSAGSSNAGSSGSSAQGGQGTGPDARPAVPTLERFEPGDRQVPMFFPDATLSKPVIMPDYIKTEFQRYVQSS